MAQSPPITLLVPQASSIRAPFHVLSCALWRSSEAGLVKLLDGNEASKALRAQVTGGVLEMQQRHGVTPGLAAVLVGDDPASGVYVRNKERACAEVGILSEVFRLPQDTSQDGLLHTVASLNADQRFHGILVQLPLPDAIDPLRVIESLDPLKDVDGIHPANLGRLVGGTPRFVPCTPAGVQQLLIHNGYDPAGKRVVICGRSQIVGLPLAQLLMQRREGANATVTVCHTRTKDLPSITRQADILVAAMGQPNAITAGMVSSGTVVVDVGVNRVPDPNSRRGYRLAGDVDFQGVAEKAEAISPVPGGVGPMTIAMLLVNTLTAARYSIHGNP